MAKISINLATGTFQQPEIIAGIDLGTSNSLVAFIDPDKQPRVINDTGKGTLVPSVVHFNDAGIPLVGNEARELLIRDPSNTICSIKRLLSASSDDVPVKIQLGEKYYTPLELSAEILKELRKRAEHALKTPVNKVVITVPAYFNDRQRQATKEAGRLAGLDVLKILNETTAASLAYSSGLDQAVKKTIAVYDFGGGAFNVAIISIHNGVFEVLASNGNTAPCGDDIDQAILNYWMENNKLDSASIISDKSLLQQLHLKAEEAKKALSSQNLFNEKAGDIWCTLDKQTFETLIAGMVAETINACKKALQEAKLPVTAIDEVVMVGGSTRIPYIEAEVSEFFRKQPNKQIDPEEIVALGAAIQADIMAGNRYHINLPDEDVQEHNTTSSASAQNLLDEARAEGEQLAYLAGQFIERHRFVLTSMDISGTRAILDKLRAALAQDDTATIRSLTTELNEFTRPFAARLLSTTATASNKKTE